MAHAAMTPLRRLLQLTVGCWQASQVELQGVYSTKRLQDFALYHRTASWRRVAMVCAFTPVPCILCVALIDLVALEPPSAGARNSPKLWLRVFTSAFIMTLSTLEHFRRHIAGIQLALRAMVWLALVVTLVTVALTIVLALLIGFPLPFGLVLGTFPWFATLMTGLAVAQWHQLQANRSLLWNGLRYLIVCSCQIAITLVYPLYNYVFARLTSSQQTGFVFALPVLKIMAKNWIARALHDSDDGKPEAVVFNIEIFHALYVAFCMGSATSRRTVFALMAVDFVQAWLSFYDIQELLSELRPIANKLDTARRRAASISSKRRVALEDLLVIAAHIVDVEPHLEEQQLLLKPLYRRRRGPNRIIASLRASVKQLLSGRLARVAPEKQVPQPTVSDIINAQNILPISDIATGQNIPSIPTCTSNPTATTGPFGTVGDPLKLPSDLATLSAVERGVLVRGTQQLLYITEFVVLVEYVEVIMPVVYNVLVLALLKLPNHQFYPFLKNLDLHDLVPTLSMVLLYASLEFVSLVVLTLVLWYKLRFSLLHQLAFVLESRQTSVQSKLVVWVIYVMQSSLDHFGADYSFRFGWLRRPQA